LARSARHRSHFFPQRADIHPPHVKQQALALIAAGVNDCEVSRRLGISRTTIRDWRRPTYVSRRRFATETCPRCWRPAKPIRFTDDDYAELLAMYLGDGCISELPRTARLRIALDVRYPEILEQTRALLERCFPHNPVDVVRGGRGTWVNVSVYCSHLPCLFPQHAAGKKHARVLQLEDWQATLVTASPWAFVRGCIRTDGCVFTNRTGPYEYLSYHFANRSGDIVGLLADACERVGVHARINFNAKRRLWDVRINRRESVQLMLRHVGKKA